MEELNRQIMEILSDPAAMEQIRGLMDSLGAGSADKDPPPAASPPKPEKTASEGEKSLLPELSALSGLLGGASQRSRPENTGSDILGGLSPELLSTVARLAPMMSRFNQEDESTRLLTALRPLLSPDRRHKVDEAVKILKMIRLLPFLKESGLFSSLLSGLL